MPATIIGDFGFLGSKPRFRIQSPSTTLHSWLTLHHPQKTSMNSSLRLRIEIHVKSKKHMPFLETVQI